MKRVAVPVVLIALLIAINAIFQHHFLAITVNPENGLLTGSLIDILKNSAPVMILAFGMTLVIGTGGVDLSVGSLVAIAGSMTGWLMTSHPKAPMAGVLLLSLGLTGFLGLINGLIVGYFRIQPIVATLVLMVSGRGIAQLLTGGQMVRLSDSSMTYWAAGHFFGIPTSVYVALVVGALVILLTRATALGMFVEATGDSEDAARAAGVDVRTVKLLVYGLSGLCAGAAGLVIMSDTKVADANTAGLYMELDAILAVVLGGTLLTGGKFSLVGSIFGALLIQTITTTILDLGVKPEANMIVKAIAVLIACLLQSGKFSLRHLVGRSAAA